MTARRSRFALLALALVATLALAAACGGGDAPPGEDAAPPDAADRADPDGAADAGAEPAKAAEPTSDPLRPVRVQIYFPADDATELVGEDRDIFDTAAPGDRAKQILSDLIEGPRGGEAVSALPRGVRVRQVYVLDDGTAYADFSRELTDLAPGGTAAELMTVYAIVNSLALNVGEIRRVGILVDGHEIETLGGHLDLRRPLPARSDLIRGSGR